MRGKEMRSPRKGRHFYEELAEPLYSLLFEGTTIMMVT